MEMLSLREMIARHVAPGQTLALEGFTHLIPFAAGQEIIRQRIGDLHLVRMTPDIIYDQMIGCGLVRELTFSWGGNPGVGSLHRLRDAIENGWPQPLAWNEHSHAGMAAAYCAGAARLPFGTLRGYLGTDLPQHNAQIRSVTCPYTGEQLATVRALNPDVTILHAQAAHDGFDVRRSEFVVVHQGGRSTCCSRRRSVLGFALSGVVDVEEGSAAAVVVGLSRSRAASAAA